MSAVIDEFIYTVSLGTDICFSSTPKNTQLITAELIESNN